MTNVLIGYGIAWLILTALFGFVVPWIQDHLYEPAKSVFVEQYNRAYPANDSNKVERGIAAQHLLENAMFRQALNDLDEHYHAIWHIAQTVEAREDLHRYVTLIPKLVDDLQSIMTTGEIEQQRQQELAGATSRKLWQTK